MMRFGVAAECITKALALVLVCCVASCVQEKPAPAPVAPDAQGAPVETSAAPAAPAAADWSQARVYVAAGNAQLGKAAEMLQQEVAKRSGVELAVSDGPASGEGPAIVLGTAAALPASFSLPAGVTVPDKADGYAAHLDGGTLYLVGHDERGALYAVGQFSRSANLAKGRIALPESLSISTAPVYAMRGHQLGYRKTANSYDAWTVETYEQYVRDCIIFGANAVEVIPSFNEEEDQSPVMPVPQEQMNRKISGMLAPYGIDVWLFLELAEDVRNPEEYRQALEARDAMFAQYPAIDHVMVPGGDPGDTEPQDLMPWLAEMVQVLRKHFPEAGLWVSNQGFTDEQNEVFFGYLQEQQPEWLTGVILGPWTQITLKEMRERTPERYPIRRYPDITHSVRCQYPVPDWDRAFSQLMNRECPNPRPLGTSHIHNLFAPLAAGFVSYSDGCHDDLNKMIWTTLAWNPDADVKEIVREYGRAFFGDAYADDVAEGLYMLEANYVGSALENEGIDATLAHWQALEDRAGADLAGNWRFQLHLLRAICDSYIRARLIAETAEEQEIYAALEGIRGAGVADAAAALHAKLSQTPPPAVRPELRKRIDELGMALHESIGMQLSVLAPYFALNPERGAILDGIDLPLNNKLWILSQLTKIQTLATEDDQNALIDRMLTWEEPKPGALYDDLGCAWKQPHLVKQATWETDPGFVEGPQCEHSRGQNNTTREFTQDRLSWLDQAQTLFRAPLKMHYEGLDASKTYTLRVTYAGRFNATMRLVADVTHEVHGPTPRPEPCWPMDFTLPQELTADGVLDLEWQRITGRGCQVAEVWLIPE